jgi:uncharacterized RDD family membrane protein YckC
MASVRSTTGLPPGVFVGATGPRLLAALVEVGPVWLLLALAALFAFVLDGRTVVAVLFVLLALTWAVLVWAQRAGKAAGIGMRLDSLQIVGFSDGRPIGWGRVLVRWLVFAGLTVTVVGLIAMLVAMVRHPRRQGWHDLAANAVVIKERPLAPPRSKTAVGRATAPAASAPAGTGGPHPARKAPATTPAVSSAAAPSAAAAATAVRSPVAADTDDERGKATDAETESADAASDDAEPDEATAVGGPTDEQPEATAYEWMLHLDDGRDVGVEHLVLLGRNPQPRVGEEDATLIKVADEGRTVSKSHLAVGVDARGLYVMDRGSTNGTTVTAADGGQRPCPPGDLIDIPAGSVVSFGDHWLEVRRPGGD